MDSSDSASQHRERSHCTVLDTPSAFDTNKSGHGKTRIQRHVVDDSPVIFVLSISQVHQKGNYWIVPPEVLIADKRWKLLGFHQQQK